MESYCLKCRKNTENIGPWVSASSNGSKISRFIKNQEGKGLLSILGVRTSLSKVPILSDILF